MSREKEPGRNWKNTEQEMTQKFNNEKTVENLYFFMGDLGKEYLPHGVTINEFLKRLDLENLEKVQKRDCLYHNFQKTFEDARVLKNVM